MTSRQIYFGVDIGGTNTDIGIVDASGNYLLGTSIPTKGDDDAKKFVLRLSEKILLLHSELANQYTLAGIGIAAPSANYYKGTIDAPSNLSWGNINLVGMMKEHFSVPIVITNDANAAALGEQAFGAAKGMQNFIVVTLGTGLGSGIVIDGNILYGQNGQAGEIGHAIAIENGRLCNCGRRGCLETYASVTGIRRTVFELLCNYQIPSELRNISYSNLTGNLIYELAKKGDPIAKLAFNYTGEILGKSLANTAAHFEPEAIILFGGLMNAGEFIMEPTLKHFENNLLEIYKGKIKLINSKLQNGMAAVLGACSLVQWQVGLHNRKVSN